MFLRAGCLLFAKMLTKCKQTRLVFLQRYLFVSAGGKKREQCCIYSLILFFWFDFVSPLQRKTCFGLALSPLSLSLCLVCLLLYRESETESTHYMSCHPLVSSLPPSIAAFKTYNCSCVRNGALLILLIHTHTHPQEHTHRSTSKERERGLEREMKRRRQILAHHQRWRETTSLRGSVVWNESVSLSISLSRCVSISMSCVGGFEWEVGGEREESFPNSIH